MANNGFVDGLVTGSRGRLDSIDGVLSRRLSCTDHGRARAAAPPSIIQNSEGVRKHDLPGRS
jgi:hypothetical protein